MGETAHIPFWAVGNDAPTPREPVAASRAAVAGIRPGRGVRMTSPAVLIGAGRSERLRALLAGPWREVNAPVAVLVLDQPAFQASVARGEWAQIAGDRRVLFGVGDDALTALDDAFGHDAAMLIEPDAIAIGDPGLSTDRCEIERAALSERHSAMLTILDGELRRWRCAMSTGASLGHPPSIFLSADRSTTALKYLGREMASAALRLGAQATFHETDLCGDPFRPIRRLRAFLDASPTLLLSFVASRARDYGAMAEGVPCISYWSSDPERYGLDRQAFSAEEIACVADRRWLTSFAQRGVRAMHLPLATGLHELAPTNPTGSGDDRVILVGNLPRAEDVLPASLRDCADACVRIATRLAHHCDESSASAIQASPLAAREDAAGSLARAVEFAVTGIERRAAAIALAKAGVKLEVRGGERWAEALSGTPAGGTWRGPIVGRAEHAREFRNAGMVVNLVSRNATDAVNMRAFDVASCGGLLVSSDRRGLREAFVVGSECAAFQTIDELIVEVQQLSADPARRESMRTQARVRALSDHTWDARWRTVFSALSMPLVRAA